MVNTKITTIVAVVALALFPLSLACVAVISFKVGAFLQSTASYVHPSTGQQMLFIDSAASESEFIRSKTGREVMGISMLTFRDGCGIFFAWDANKENLGTFLVDYSSSDEIDFYEPKYDVIDKDSLFGMNCRKDLMPDEAK